MSLLSGETAPEIYGAPGLGRPSTSLQQLSPRHTMVSSACGGRVIKSGDVCYDDRGMSTQGMGLEACGVTDMGEDGYSPLQAKKSPPSNGKKTKGRVKIKMEYIENKLRRYTTFSKRKTGIMKKVSELTSTDDNSAQTHAREPRARASRRKKSRTICICEQLSNFHYFRGVYLLHFRHAHVSLPKLRDSVDADRKLFVFGELGDSIRTRDSDNYRQASRYCYIVGTARSCYSNYEHMFALTAAASRLLPNCPRISRRVSL